MMIVKGTDRAPVKMLPGILRKTLVEGDKIMICEFTLERGAEIPVHTHPQEQAGYVASGRARLIIDGREFELGPGDTYHAASNVPHGAVILEPSVIVDSFCPPREDYRQG